MATLREALGDSGHAQAEYGEYTVVVEDGEDHQPGEVLHDPVAGDIELEGETRFGYWLTVSQGAMPPHSTRFFEALDLVEAYVDEGNLFGQTDLDWGPVEGD